MKNLFSKPRMITVAMTILAIVALRKSPLNKYIGI
jgi:hypothetical protein